MSEAISKDDIKAIREFNNNLRWLRLKDLKENFTSSAEDIAKVTGWSKERIRGERERGSIKFKKDGFHYRYDLSSLPEIYKQKIIYGESSKSRNSMMSGFDAKQLADEIATALMKKILEQLNQKLPRI